MLKQLYLPAPGALVARTGAEDTQVKIFNRFG